MAQRLPDGSLKMADGRVIYADTLIQAQDLFELMPIIAPAPAWPFVSGGGGGGGSGTPGARGADGAAGAPGAQGPQGTNPGVQGPQGLVGRQGNQGSIGSGAQGAQGVIGAQGAQGIGSGAQGNQGNQGIVGAQGLQGILGAQGAQGNQGSVGSGIQGAQGIQTPEAATFVVSPTPGVGDFTTIQAAINALPPEGGKILIREGTYPITSEITIPDKQVFLDGCGTQLSQVSGQGTVIDLGANAINAFHQLGSQHIKIANLHVLGTDDIVQTFWVADNPDGSNFVDFENVTVDRMQNGFRNPAGSLFVRVSQFYMTNEDNDGDDSPGSSFTGNGSIEGINSQINGGNITGTVDLIGADFNLILDNCVVLGPNQVHFLFITDSYISGQIQIIAGGMAHVEGCHFVQFIGTPTRYLDFDVGAGPSSVIGCDMVTPAAVEEIRTASTGLTVVGCTTFPRVTETNFFALNIFSDIATASTIIGRDTIVNGARRFQTPVDAATQDAYFTLFTHQNHKALLGIGTIKNTDGANFMTVKETVTDGFGVTDFTETVVAPGTDYTLNPQTNKATARPPYLSYSVAVKSTTPGSSATWAIQFGSQGATS